MEVSDFQSVVVIPHLPPLAQEGCFDALLTYAEVARYFAGDADWVRHCFSDSSPNVAPSQALHLRTSSSNVNCATPVKRRGKSMSRRTGQAGHIEQSGKWWVVRWWMDVGGQEERTHKRARICPVSGPGVLSKSERTRRARAIIAESGADTVDTSTRWW